MENEEYSVTKLAFTSISRENWLMLKRLNKEDTYSVIQALADYVLDGTKQETDGLVDMVFEQVSSVIDRKGKKTLNSIGNFSKGKSDKNSNTAEVTTIAKTQEPKEPIADKTPTNSNDDFKDAMQKRTEYVNQIRQQRQKNVTLPPPPTTVSFDECVKELLSVYEDKGYDAMVTKMNYKKEYPFSVLKEVCDKQIKEVYG